MYFKIQRPVLYHLQKHAAKGQSGQARTSPCLTQERLWKRLALPFAPQPRPPAVTGWNTQDTENTEIPWQYLDNSRTYPYPLLRRRLCGPPAASALDWWPGWLLPAPWSTPWPALGFLGWRRCRRCPCWCCGRFGQCGAHSPLSCLDSRSWSQTWHLPHLPSRRWVSVEVDVAGKEKDMPTTGGKHECRWQQEERRLS